MFLLSQDKDCLVNIGASERLEIFHYSDDEPYRILARWFSNTKTIAEYSTQEEVQKAFRDLTAWMDDPAKEHMVYKM